MTRRRRFWRAGLALVATIFAPSVLRAQRALPTLDIGGTSVRYADSVSSSAFTLAPAVRLDWTNATVGLAGSLSQLDGSLSTQGLATASFYSPAAGPLVGELAGTLGGSSRDGGRTGQALALGRVHLMTDRRGVWGGFGGGTAYDGVSSHSVILGEAGAWMQFGNATALATLTPQAVDDSMRFADAEAAVRWELPRVDVGVSAGYRSGRNLPAWGGGSRSWGSGSITAWVSPRFALVGTVGTYPVDPTQGFPGGRYLSLSVRIGARGPRTTDREPSTTVRPIVVEEHRTSVAGVSAFTVTAEGRGRYVLRVHAPAARSVEVGGDFTNWDAVALSPARDGWWAVTLPIEPGTHQLNVRVDGGRWLVPPGVTAVTDEFGGAVGVISVP